MSFSQEKLNPQANTGADETPRCNGCDCHCKFGIHYFYRLNFCRLNFHCLIPRVEDWFCPTINGNQIKQYKGPNGQIIDASRKVPFHLNRSAKEQAIELAHEIVKYCDHYKTR